MIGDRYLTDIVYGNRNGLLTIRPAPLTLEGEPSAVLLVSCYKTVLQSLAPAVVAVVIYRSCMMTN